MINLDERFELYRVIDFSEGRTHYLPTMKEAETEAGTLLSADPDRVIAIYGVWDAEGDMESLFLQGYGAGCEAEETDAQGD